MRANNLPGPEEGAILYHHIVTYYGGHSVGELKLAFDMAISGQLDLDDKEVNPYESFDCRYVSKILNSYRVWARQVVKQHTEKELPQLPATGTRTDWRQEVQTALESFLSGNLNFRLCPAEMYDQVSADCFINGLAYKSFMDKARNKFCGEINRELAGMRPQDAAAMDSMDTGKYRDYQSLEKKLIQYRNGERDIEVILLAKQMALRHYFQYLKSVEVNKIYQPA